jgi:hypothetical protein
LAESFAYEISLVLEIRSAGADETLVLVLEIRSAGAGHTLRLVLMKRWCASNSQ